MLPTRPDASESARRRSAAAHLARSGRSVRLADHGPERSGRESLSGGGVCAVPAQRRRDADHACAAGAPENRFVSPKHYNELFTMHGSIMMFLVTVPIMEAFASFALPLLLGARELPFPRMTAFGFWTFVFGAALLYSSRLFGRCRRRAGPPTRRWPAPSSRRAWASTSGCSASRWPRWPRWAPASS